LVAAPLSLPRRNISAYAGSNEHNSQAGEAPVLAGRRSLILALRRRSWWSCHWSPPGAPASCSLEHKTGEIFSIEERELTNCTQ
jgi:hypothetical protein